jgi:hypothetical protein
MKANDKVVKKATQLKQSVTETVQATTDKLEKIAHEAKDQAVEVIHDTQLKIEDDVNVLNTSIQQQIQAFKQELLDRLAIIKKQMNLSQDDVVELKSFVKQEFNVVLDDLTKFGQSLKLDVIELTSKHKEQLSGTFVRTKAHAAEVWDKVNSK